MTKLIEQLTQAEHALGFAVGHLRDANGNASPLASLIILDAIRDAADVANRVKAILDAVKSDPTPDLVAALEYLATGHSMAGEARARAALDKVSH